VTYLPPAAFTVPAAGGGRFTELSVAEWDARADASARRELYQSLGGWDWNVARGAYRRCQAWWSQKQYLAQLTDALGTAAATRERRGMVSVARCRAVAEILASSADHRTGRNAMPGIDTLVERTGFCERSIQYAIGALERLGYLHRVSEGRNWLSKTERLQLWCRRSRARAHRAIWALTAPITAAVFIPEIVPTRPRHAGAVDNPNPANPGSCTLPYTGKENHSSCGLCFSIPSENPSTQACGHSPKHGLTADKTEGAAPPHQPSTRRRRSPWSPELIDLVTDLQRALPGLLGHERASRLAGTLSRFHKAGWDALSLETVIRDACARKGRTLTGHRPTRPYAWLATVLRPINHQDHPQLLAAVDRMYDRLYNDTFCPHDVERGAQPTAAGIMPCPLCRHGDTGPSNPRAECRQ
jgi:hypothetical protein